MNEEILKIIEFENLILSEYSDKKMEYSEHKKSVCNCKNDPIGTALFLIDFVKSEIKSRQRLPDFFIKLNSDIQHILIGVKDRINTHNCVNCSLKHVASAAVIINEILNGYENSDHEMFLMGNLNEATEQIAETSVEISNELRNLRVDIFENDQKITQTHLKRAKGIYRKIRQLSDIEIKPEQISRNSVNQSVIPKAPCGCGKKNLT
jgi:hypothetical protein